MKFVTALAFALLAAQPVLGDAQHPHAVAFAAGSRFDIPVPARDAFTISFWMQTTATGLQGTQWWQGTGLVDADQVARRVADGEVLGAPELLGRLLHDLGARGAHLLEGGVEVVGVEVDAVQGALGQQGGERVDVGGAAVQVVGEDDPDVGLGGGADGDPAEVFAGNVVAQFEAERVAVEGQCEVGVMD